eukprot:1156244-Pelagomonas_calceolata.AAC.8
MSFPIDWHIALNESSLLDEFGASRGQQIPTLFLLMSCRAIQDPEVSPIIRDCIAIVACYVPPTMILELLGPRIADGCEDLRSRAAALEVLAHVVRVREGGGEVRTIMIPR